LSDRFRQKDIQTILEVRWGVKKPAAEVIISGLNLLLFSLEVRVLRSLHNLLVEMVEKCFSSELEQMLGPASYI